MRCADRPRRLHHRQPQARAVPLVPEIRLYRAHPGSGLRGATPATPYWAYPWAGGIVLARHILDNPRIVAGRRVLDLGAGGGLVAIAAAMAGALAVTATESDMLGRVALGLNASANDVRVAVLEADRSLSRVPVPAVDLILAGDVFYAPAVARQMAAFRGRCHAAGIEVLVGDPDRRGLPRSRLARCGGAPCPMSAARRANWSRRPSTPSPADRHDIVLVEPAGAAAVVGDLEPAALLVADRDLLAAGERKDPAPRARRTGPHVDAGAAYRPDVGGGRRGTIAVEALGDFLRHGRDDGRTGRRIGERLDVLTCRNACRLGIRRLRRRGDHHLREGIVHRPAWADSRRRCGEERLAVGGNGHGANDALGELVARGGFCGRRGLGARERGNGSAARRPVGRDERIERALEQFGSSGETLLLGEG